MPELPRLLKNCTWPEYPALSNLALRQAVQFIITYVKDVRSILVSGTIVRGNTSPSSDVEIHVIGGKNDNGSASPPPGRS